MNAIVGYVSDKHQKELSFDVKVINAKMSKKQLQSFLKDEASKLVDRSKICYTFIKEN